MRFIAIVSVSCASGDRAPSDMADEMNRARMASIGATCSSGMGEAGRSVSRSRTVVGAPPAARSANVRYASSGLVPARDARALPTACCSASTVWGAQACCSLSLRKRMRP
jgi:hypothetical protein